MFDVDLMLMAADVTNYLWSGMPPKQNGNDHTLSGGRCYETKDGLLMLGAMNRNQHERLFLLIDETEIARNTNSSQRILNSEDQAQILTNFLSEKSAEYWEKYFQENHIPAAKVLPLNDALEDTQIKNRNILHAFPNFMNTNKPFTVPIPAFKYSHGSPSIETPPSQLGQHTNEVLREIGVTDEELKEFRTHKII